MQIYLANDEGYFDVLARSFCYHYQTVRITKAEFIYDLGNIKSLNEEKSVKFIVQFLYRRHMT